MLELTFWEKARIQHTDDDFDGILTIRLKSVKDIPALVANKPKQCAMISMERSAPVLKRDKSGPTNPLNPKHFKEIWREGQSLPAAQTVKCPLCGCEKNHA